MSTDRYCDGVRRRDFLRLGVFGATGLSLANYLRLAEAGQVAGGKATSAIFVNLGGGPSHMDTFDLKPDAPKEFRGEFNPIATNVPGIQICEHLPRQARMFDKLAVIRSVISVGEHSDSMVTTGYSARDNLAANHPSFGAVVSKLRGDGG